MSLSDSDVDVVVVDRDDISNYNPEQILPLKSEEIHRVRSWLQPTSYDIAGGEYRKHLASHVAGTGAWLTSSDTYQEWLTGTEHGLLWLRGIPGSGKSVIAANLVSELSKSNPGSPVLFFFFRQIIDANHEPAALLRDWMDQLLRYSPPLQTKLLKYVKGDRAIDSISIEDMFKDLRMAFTSLPGKVFCIGDALDEMDRGHDSFLEALGSLGQWRPETVKVLITSRPVPIVEVPLRNIPCLRLRLEESLVDVDISTYVHSALSSSAIPQESWKVIADAVPGRANGLFLYAKLAMDAFLQPGADINTVLTQLPADLNALYTDLLEEHAQRSGVAPDIQHLILQSVTHATRPLRLLELAEMIKVCSPDGSTRDLKATKDLIRAACGPLLEILPDETISVIHHSFTEYLKGTTRADDSIGYPVLKPGPTHAQLSLACLRYLQSGCLSVEDITEDNSYEMGVELEDLVRDAGDVDIIDGDMDMRLEYPFYVYAKGNWRKHVNSSEAAGYDQAIVNAQLRTFLELVEMMHVQVGNKSRGGNPLETFMKLHIAAKVGLVSYTKELLETMEVDERDDCGRTPLWWAATSGHAATMRALIVAGANPDQDDEPFGFKPLHEAAKKNHFESVRVLLEAGVDPLTPKTRETPGRSCGNAPRTTGHTALMYACNHGHLESVDAFMPFLKDIDTVHRALAWAIDSRASKVVARILQHPSVDVNAKVGKETPLCRACGVRDLATVEALLQAGADPECGSEYDKREFSREFMEYPGEEQPKFSGMHKLCGVETGEYRSKAEPEVEEGIFNLLVQAGADIHRRCYYSGETPLHGAARSSAVLTRLLLDAGADANASNNFGQTPLHLVKYEGPLALLVEEGHANLNPRDNDGRTPLLNLLSIFHKETSLKFLEYGPDCNIINSNGDGPLHLALGGWNSTPDIIKALLKSGADPNLKNRNGLTPILTIRDYDEKSRDVVDLLLQAGADIDATDREGRTLLFKLASVKPSYYDERGYNPDMMELIARCASTSVRDFSGRTLLHEVVRYHGNTWENHSEGGQVPRLDFLLDLGLDTTAVDHLGNSLLHEVALLENNHNRHGLHVRAATFTQFWEKLISLGLDLGHTNHAGCTPLHILCTAVDIYHYKPGAVMPIDFVILHTENLDVTDHDGNTPLHLAAAAGESYVKKLLEAGADPTAATRKGMTPLHIASCSRHPNVVGLLLDAMRKHQATSLHMLGGSQTPTFCRLQTPTFDGSQTVSSNEETTPPDRVVGVDATLSRGSPVTPLYYACRSGRPETVALLLEAGANVTNAMFQACAEFEKEDELSRRGSTNGFSSPNQGDLTVNETTRLPEILDMLWAHRGFDSPDRTQIEGLIDKALGERRDYTAACFGEFLRRYLADDGGTKSPSSGGRFVERRDFPQHRVFPKYAKFSEYIHHSLRQASAQGLKDLESVEIGGGNPELFHCFMVRREYHLVEELVRLGGVFLPIPGSQSAFNLSTLVRHGFASLVDSIGTLEAASRLEKGDWHAFGDPTQPGLWLAKRDLSKPGINGSNPLPFILEAARSKSPNMDVLRLLVEKFGVDVNEMSFTHEHVDRVRMVVPTDSALHSVASGQFWWHVHQALPYLLKTGADLNARDYKGRTPLHAALDSNENYAGEAARVLVEAGADTNAVDKKGRTCLGYVKGDIAMTEFLIAHGAAVTADAMLTAIDYASASSLRALLSGGTDPNMRRDKLPPPDDMPHKEYEDLFKLDIYDSRGIVDGVEPHEVYPLYYATRNLKAPKSAKEQDYREFEKRLEVVQVLLDHGADPFSKYMRKVKDNRSRRARAAATQRNISEVHEESVLHQLLAKGRFVDNFLHLPGLDVNRQDGRGLTVLLAACLGKGPDYVIDSHRPNSDTGNEGSTTIFQHLLSLGADPAARDNSGRSALHIMVGSSHKYADFEKSLAEALLRAPELVNQPDADGKTPLHHAASRTVLSPADLAGDFKLVSVLLSAGADPLAADVNGDTVLHFLASNLGYAERCALFRDFVGRGADVNARNARGETPLWPYCARDRVSRYNDWWEPQSGEEEMGSEVSEKEVATPMLVGLGADFFASDGRGRGLLHVAASGDVDRFKELMGLGLDPLLEDEGQRTAIDLAVACGNTEVLALFEKQDMVRERKAVARKPLFG